MERPIPQTRDVLLIGGGHAHALVLRRWGMGPLPGARLTLVDPEPIAAYTGMLPGYVAGHYRREDLDIDLVRLATFAGARFIQSRVCGLDADARFAEIEGRPPIRFDVASIDIGISSSLAGVQSTDIVPAKPLGPFADRWDAYLAGLNPKSTPAIAIIGGGLGGVELALAMAWRLKQVGAAPKLTIYDSHGLQATGLKGTVRKSLSVVLKTSGVAVETDAKVVSVEGSTLMLADGRRRAADFVVAVAGARPPNWLTSTALELQDGFIRVDRTLQAIKHDGIFAVGDIAHMDETPRPKAGVFAVRQAPILLTNLKAALSGRYLKPYRPQKDYLKLVSLGRKSALGQRFGASVSGPRIWAWKDRIDRAFMAKLSNLPSMPDRPQPHYAAIGVAEALAKQPLCGGCGAKIDAKTLSDGIAGDLGDDAAILPDTGEIVTTDHLRPVHDDPYVQARITATHALGDVWAMGAAPKAALVSIVLPPLSPPLQNRTLREVQAGFESVFGQFACPIVGGHTSEGGELTLGATIIGTPGARGPVRQTGARAGDVLVLTKPLGTGVVMAAAMRSEADGRDVCAAVAQMQMPSAWASEVLSTAASAMTNVTGFGLLGHARPMIGALNHSIQVELDRLPFCSGAIDLSAKGIRASLFEQNSSALEGDLEDRSRRSDDPRWSLLFDPQTSGGLLAAIPEQAVSEVISRFEDERQPIWRI
ncbi:MAG: selenide, water dikinase SelD, partial [Pseudomonadota bacterium]